MSKKWDVWEEEQEHTKRRCVASVLGHDSDTSFSLPYACRQRASSLINFVHIIRRIWGTCNGFHWARHNYVLYLSYVRPSPMICEMMGLNVNLPADFNPDLGNDAALDRGTRSLVVDGAGRLSEIWLSPGGNFEHWCSVESGKSRHMWHEYATVTKYPYFPFEVCGLLDEGECVQIMQGCKDRYHWALSLDCCNWVSWLSSIRLQALKFRRGHRALTSLADEAPKPDSTHI